ncbi:Peptidase S10 serine carboxypeptidase [Penicillium capsulatum]|uniref:Carboxypeptidase n=1 Tax=Penicillium capsulatum TaxID=69766 RepID=A0A9W9LZW8_9EURO|nr:Peptidase S10 serine carboxypeptidase [Penicillium capsulatum]KAJ6129303.1 Peptidase S10 serine carboxypeptidase [Penicillium capsulatum]
MSFSTVLYFFHVLWAIPNFVFSRQPESRDSSRFEVVSLPDSPSLPDSWAGRLPVPGAEAGNDIFFWLFETEDDEYDDNLIIWLNGGPGCSSLIGLTTGNGPISFVGNSTRLERNPYSWTKLGHVLYVDQPVGTGLSTASDPYPLHNNDGVTTDFVSWLREFVSYFPHLQSKELHLIGESYAGIYIPYIAAALLDGNGSLSLNLRSMSLGDGSWGNAAAMSSVAVGTYMHSQSSLLKVPKNILAAFSSADHACGFDDTLKQANSYPPTGKIHVPGDPEHLNHRRRSRRDLVSVGNGECDTQISTPAEVSNSILNSTCNGPCATFSTALNYLAVISVAGTGPACFDIYDIHHDCETVDPLPLLAEYFSRGDVQSALHAGNAGSFSPCNSTILGTLLAVPPPPPAYSVLPDLVTNHNISLHFYNGEWDMLINHLGTELSIQNMTWHGAQGFSQKPSRPFYANDAAPETDDDQMGNAIGIWTAERGVSYHLFHGAGHSVFATKQQEMFAYVRDAVLGEETE